MLVGALSGSELVVTAVLVPNQRGSSDMCEMTNEEEIWECVPSYARNRRSCRSRRNPPLRRHIDQDQINLGWVHTHPTQTSFMSSIDLHIHMPYQMLLDEVAAYRGRTHPAFEADGRINTPTRLSRSRSFSRRSTYRRAASSASATRTRPACARCRSATCRSRSYAIATTRTTNAATPPSPAPTATRAALCTRRLRTCDLTHKGTSSSSTFAVEP